MPRSVLHVSDKPAAPGQKKVTATCGLRVDSSRIATITPQYPLPSCVGCRAILIERAKEAR